MQDANIILIIVIHLQGSLILFSHLIFLSRPSQVTPASTSLVLGLEAWVPKCWDHLWASSVSRLDRIDFV